MKVKYDTEEFTMRTRPIACRIGTDHPKGMDTGATKISEFCQNCIILALLPSLFLFSSFLYFPILPSLLPLTSPSLFLSILSPLLLIPFLSLAPFLLPYHPLSSYSYRPFSITSLTSPVGSISRSFLPLPFSFPFFAIPFAPSPPLEVGPLYCGYGA